MGGRYVFIQRSLSFLCHSYCTLRVGIDVCWQGLWLAAIAAIKGTGNREKKDSCFQLFVPTTTIDLLEKLTEEPKWQWQDTVTIVISSRTNHKTIFLALLYTEQSLNRPVVNQGFLVVSLVSDVYVYKSSYTLLGILNSQFILLFTLNFIMYFISWSDTCSFHIFISFI